MQTRASNQEAIDGLEGHNVFGVVRFDAATVEDANGLRFISDLARQPLPDGRVGKIDLVGGQSEMVQRLCEVFLEELPQSIHNMTTAMREGDAAAQEESAHSLKGAAGVVCAARLRELVIELEVAGREGRTSPQKLECFEEVAEATEAELRAYLASESLGT